MSEITRSIAWNPGGGNWLEIVPAAFIASYSSPSPTAPAAIVLHPGREWTLVYTTPETLQYQEDATSTDNGKLYTIAIKGFSANDNAAKRQALESIFNYTRMVVRFKDNAGQLRQAGTPIEALELTYQLGTDAQVSGSRGYDLSLKGTLTAPCSYE